MKESTKENLPARLARNLLPQIQPYSRPQLPVNSTFRTQRKKNGRVFILLSF